MEGGVKCNIDAALYNDQQKFGIGMCIQDDQGAFVKARTMCFNSTQTPMENEAWTLKEAITWVGRLELSRVAIEHDCLLVVNAIQNRTKNLTELGNIYRKNGTVRSNS
jgi:ribonuclease HI